jgi:hypothetical protein
VYVNSFRFWAAGAASPDNFWTHRIGCTEPSP